MAQKPGILRTIFGNIRKSLALVNTKEVYKGEDHLGNKYYERIADPSKGIKQIRRVEARSEDKFRTPEVPTEWNSWLRNRRNEPPTEEEILKNYTNMVITQKRAQEIEENMNPATEEQDGKIGVTLQQDSTGKVKFPVYPGFEKTPGESLIKETDYNSKDR